MTSSRDAIDGDEELEENRVTILVASMLVVELASGGTTSRCFDCKTCSVDLAHV